MFNFTMEIKSYEPGRGFSVVYTPEDPDLPKRGTIIDIGEVYDQEQVINILKGASPQEEWRAIKDALNAPQPAAEFYQTLVGTVVQAVDPYNPAVDPESDSFSPELTPATVTNTGTI